MMSFADKWKEIASDPYHLWSLSPGELHSLIEEAVEEIESLRSDQPPEPEWIYAEGPKAPMTRESFMSLLPQDDTLAFWVWRTKAWSKNTYCYKCNKSTPSIEGCCTKCNLSKTRENT